MKQVYFKSLHKRLIFNDSIIAIYFESPILYQNLHYTLEEELLLSDENSILDFNSQIYVLYNIFEVSLSDKKIINALYKKLEKSTTIETKEQINNIKQNFIKILRILSFDIDFPIQFNEDFSLSKLLSLFQVGFEEVNKKNYVEYLISFFKIVSELLNINLFITFGLSTYLIQDEYLLLKKELSILNINILDLCYTYKPYQKECLLVDGDWCII